MKMNNLIGAGLMLAVSCAAQNGSAADVTVSASHKVNLGPGETLRTSTVAAKSLPAGLADKVLYHFDATDVTGWEFTDASQTKVKKIPSDYGTRYLTSTPDSTWKPANWGASYPFVAPTYVSSVTALGGKPAVDFGAIGSGCAMVFNPDAANADKNLITNIGTVVAVWGSEHGGGWLLSGGEGRKVSGSSEISDYLGHRSTIDPATGVSGETYTWRNPLWIDPGWYAVCDAWVYHDGQPGAARYVGFNGGWEVLSVVMNTKRCQLPNTAGLGINDAREGAYFKTNRSGGMGVAEIFYFSEQLSEANRKAVEAYLQAKWFGRAAAGHNGNAEVGLVRVNKTEPDQNPAWGVNATVEVAAGDTLTVGELTGGRRGGTLTKSGAGTLALGKSDGYGGMLRVAEGAVAFPRRSVPAALPANAWFRLDASDASSLVTVEEGGVTYVSKWANKAEANIGGKTADTLAVIADTDAARPVLLADALGAGKPALDFGVLNSGRFLRAKGGATPADLSIPGVTAAFVVMAPTFSGGTVFGDPTTTSHRGFLDRGADSFARGIVGFNEPIWLNKTWHDDNNSVAFNGDDGTTRQDGKLIDPNKGFFSCGWQVLGVTTPGASVSAIGGGRANVNYTGGFRVAEIVLYNRPLTDQEMRDAEAYLRDKWFGQPAAGYAASSPRQTAELQNVTLANGAELSVPDATAVRIGALTTEGVFVKSGAGTLAVEALPSSIDVQLNDGTIQTVAKSDPPAFDQPAAEPAFHLDAAEAKSLVFHSDKVGTTNYVMQWQDVRGSGNVAYCPRPEYAKHAPYVDSTRSQNGHPVVDFGVNDTEYRRLHFNRSQDAIRSVYVVWGTRGKALTAGVLLGSAHLSATDTDSDHKNGAYDFLRNSAELFSSFQFQLPVSDYSDIYVNGVKSSRTYHPVEGFQLIEVHTQEPVHASALCDDRVGIDPAGATYAGGLSYGEILLYERELTEREKVATRNYLMKKWFGKTDEELTPLPGTAPTAPTLNVNVLYAGTDSRFNGSLTPADVRGAANAMATVTGDMTVGDINVYTGKLVVAEGVTLTVTNEGALTRSAPRLVQDGMIMHLDATQGVDTDESGVITKWHNQVAGGLDAVPGGKPLLKTDGLFGGRPYVFMYGWSWQGGTGDKRNCFYFANQNGETNRLSNIRSAFWVLNSKDGGGILLSGGDELHHNSWYRGGSPKNPSWHGMVYSDAPILDGGAIAVARSASWMLNAAVVDPCKTGLSGGNDLISMNMSSEEDFGNAWGFGFNAHFHSDGTIETCGWQYLAELVIYDRVLSDEERNAVEVHLSQKWGLGVYKRTAGDASDVELQAGSKLDLDGNDCGLGTLSGSGTVDQVGKLRVTKLDVGSGAEKTGAIGINGDLILADGATWVVNSLETPLTVCGQLSFEGAMTFDLRGIDLSSLPDNGLVCLATASSAGRMPVRARISAIGTDQSCRLIARDGKVYLRVGAAGLSVIVR